MMGSWRWVIPSNRPRTIWAMSPRSAIHWLIDKPREPKRCLTNVCRGEIRPIAIFHQYLVSAL